jgi:hypothetical protein
MVLLRYKDVPRIKEKGKRKKEKGKRKKEYPLSPNGVRGFFFLSPVWRNDFFPSPLRGED